MIRRLAAVTLVVPLLLLPTAGAAGGRPHVPRGSHVHGASPLPRAVQAIPVFRPNGAFGSPGGYPLPSSAIQRPRDAFPAHVTRRFRHHGVFPGFVSPIALYSPGLQYGVSADPSPTVVSVSPVVYVSPTIYVSQPVAAQPVPIPVAAPAEPPLPTVVEHPTGRYELRGDGVATPHVWVWIPHPPAAPPDVAPPASPARSTGRTTAYRWTDESGTMFVTNRLEQVPEPYRPSEPPLR
jgi:hypothetical protein